MACTIGFGRRIGTGELLSSTKWGCFRAQVRGGLKGCNAIIIADCEGLGEWEGVAEPCACIVFDGSAITPVGWQVLRKMLCELAKEYGQDAIALTIGATEFIKGS